ncbi:hypothetical protein GZL_08784 [Streptomyces sp. 769]|nr:hypothetical protein GZL_08784 [Streptomyces sp. 769]
MAAGTAPRRQHSRFPNGIRTARPPRVSSAVCDGGGSAGPTASTRHSFCRNA